MALDQYSICPCGNGKKIKFCKCHDHLAEMQKIDRMIQGNQSVAALDRINDLLKPFPSEPWLLAMKCELLLKLQENELLEETSAKFIRLQPDNPLAKTYRSLVAVMRGSPEEAAGLLIQAIASSQGVLPPIFLNVAIYLLELLMTRRYSLTGLMHAEMLLSLTESSENNEITGICQQIYQNITTEAKTSILQREMPPSPPEASDEPYGERYREALALLNRNEIHQSKTKLEAMQREFGAQPPLLIAKLYCQLMIAEVESAAETCLKLSKIATLPLAQQVYFQALAFELSPLKSGVYCPFEVCTYDLTDDQAMEQRLVSSTRLIPMKDGSANQIVARVLNEEVPPKSQFMVGYPLPNASPEVAALKPRASGTMVCLMGRQTDKPPRLVTIEPTRGWHATQMKSVLEELQAPAEGRKVIETTPSSLIANLVSTVRVDLPPPPELEATIQNDIKTFSIDSFLDFPAPLLNGGTPRSRAGESEYKNDLHALALSCLASGALDWNYSDYTSVLSTLKLDPITLPAGTDLFDTVGGASYFFADVANLDSPDFLQLAQSALTRRVVPVYSLMADSCASRTWDEESKNAAKFTEYSMRAGSSRSIDEVLKWTELLYQTGRDMGVPVGNVALERFELLQAAGRSEEASAYLQKAISDNPNDPYLMEFLQMVQARMQQEMMERGRGGESRLEDALSRNMMSGRAMNAPTPAGNSGSGLWTPDQPPSRPAENNQGSGSGSGLWLPGQ